ncbi:MAG: NHL repeat-containing protein [Acidobacteriota bacterium]
MKSFHRSKSRYFFPVILLGVVFFFIGEKDGIAGKNFDNELKSPVRITFGPANNLIVSDYNARSIYTIDRNKNKILKGFKINGRPLAVAYLKGKYYVGNDTSDRIEVYTESGKIKSTFNGKVKKPNDMVIDEKNKKVYVVDTKSSSVLLYSLEGVLSLTITENLTNPMGIAIDSINGLVYVSDYGDPASWKYPAIHIFDLSGIYTGTISGKLGMFGNRFSRPQGLAIDDNGYVFMVDCYSSEIMVFNGPGGILVKTLSGFGTGPGRMALPYDIVLNKKTLDLFVTNNRGASVEIFENGGQL